ncbi:hypothetical protein Ade02nite_83890 [Paractinoplanes deccanensis]|uniref:Uncharacterized protein n=1 Tax=Paractinoplanes deccanensis TaxID=113561 RepID=A0ABQ3YIC5_9ACTN|nr:hypothetical protein Ade02nite_83890 [Actinoplanes deccanensis]
MVSSGALVATVCAFLFARVGLGDGFLETGFFEGDALGDGVALVLGLGLGVVGALVSALSVAGGAKGCSAALGMVLSASASLVSPAKVNPDPMTTAVTPATSV